MRYVLIALIASAAVADAPKPPSTEDTLVADLASAKFVDSTTPNSPKGSQQALLGVDPNTKGATAYAKTPAGTGLPAHWHSHPEYTVLISGAAALKIAGKTQQIGPGAYFVIPAKMPHQLTCNAGADCLLLTRRGGPTDYNFVKP